MSSTILPTIFDRANARAFYRQPFAPQHQCDALPRQGPEIDLEAKNITTLKFKIFALRSWTIAFGTAEGRFDTRQNS
jgi:hypothetical protein